MCRLNLNRMLSCGRVSVRRAVGAVALVAATVMQSSADDSFREQRQALVIGVDDFDRCPDIEYAS
jgi:hypothetical protein